MTRRNQQEKHSKSRAFSILTEPAVKPMSCSSLCVVVTDVNSALSGLQVQPAPGRSSSAKACQPNRKKNRRLSSTHLPAHALAGLTEHYRNIPSRFCFSTAGFGDRHVAPSYGVTLTKVSSRKYGLREERFLQLPANPNTWLTRPTTAGSLISKISAILTKRSPRPAVSVTG